jgi:pyrophosphatase PpaX
MEERRRIPALHKSVRGSLLASIGRVRFPVVLFDFDGTIVDSGVMILASFRHATRTVLDRDLSDAELLAAVGTPLRDQMQLIDAERADELVDVYRAHNEPLHEALEACDGMLEILRGLKDEGRRLGIVTSKRGATVELAFAVLPLREYFDAVVTADDAKRHKPHPDPLLEALDRLDARPEQAAYVGDAPFDVAAAKAAGVHAVAVTWGGMHSEEALRASEPDAIVSTPEELLDVV